MIESGGEPVVHRSAVQGTVWLTQAQIAELHDTSVPRALTDIERGRLDGGDP